MESLYIGDHPQDLFLLLFIYLCIPSHQLGTCIEAPISSYSILKKKVKKEEDYPEIIYTSHGSPDAPFEA
jgi:hypothetical protein